MITTWNVDQFMHSRMPYFHFYLVEWLREAICFTRLEIFNFCSELLLKKSFLLVKYFSVSLMGDSLVSVD